MTVGTFVYTPSIRAHIATDQTIWDVSDDITEAVINRRLGVSSFSLTLANRGRKYDAAFSPMDRVTIYLRRIGPYLLVLSGYIDSAPIFSTYTGSIRLRGSCTLKRLQHWAWDPGTQAGATLLTDLLRVKDNPSVTDGGIAERVVKVMGEVMDWPKEKIHIGAMPTNWFDTLGTLGKDLIDEAEQAEMVSLNGSGAMAGQNAMKGTSVIDSDIPGTGTLPRQIVTLGRFGGERGHPGPMELTGEPTRLSDDRRAQWGGRYYVRARWPYRVAGGAAAPDVDVAKARGWWKNRKILLTNPHTGKAVVCRAADWGPDTGADVEVSQPAWSALGIKPGQMVNMAFAPESASTGPVVISTAPNVIDSSALPPVVGPLVQVIQQSADAVKAMAAYTHPRQKICNTFAALEDFLRWCTNNGITVHEHPSYGGVTPGYHMSIEEGGMHWWPAPNGGGAADIYVSGNGTRMERLLDGAAIEAARRGLGIIWRAPNHTTHMHVDISDVRQVGPMVYASNATLNSIPRPQPIDGSPGDPYAGGGAGGGGSGAMDPVQMGEALFQTFEFMRSWDTEASGRLGGKRALMNDVPLYGTVDELFKVGLRDWCSAPNGDLIGWFPDYFSRYGTAAKMVIEPIEVMGEGFEVEWTDDRLKTHVFVTSAASNAGYLLQNPGGSTNATNYTQMERTAGIASVEFPEMMQTLFGLGGPLYNDGGKAFLSKFGARPDWRPMNIISGPRAEFFFAVDRFMRNWSEQFRASINITFMPELYPGMIAAFPHWGVQAYVQGVTHTINMQTGFTTQPILTAWSSIKGMESVVPGLPRGGAL